MRAQILAISLATAALGLAGCTNPDGTRDNRATGATVGALGGAAVGNLITGDSRGALVGAAAGGATGAAVGRNRDLAQQ